MSNSTLSTFEAKLKTQDWTYEMSDDSLAYSKGSKLCKELKKEALELGEDAVKLYNQYDEKFAYPKNPIKV